MTETDVLNARKKVLNSYASWYPIFFFLGFVGILGTIFYTPLILSSLLIFVGMFLSFKHQENWDNWRKTIVDPYIDSLALDKREIVKLKIDIDSGYQTGRHHAYTRASKIKLRDVEVSFVDNGLSTLEGWYEVDVDLEPGEKPYITYQYVSEYLGGNVDAGYYNPIIHLPKDYNFKNQMKN